MSVNMESEMDFDDKKFYMNYLDGLTDDMPDEFFRLAQVFELNLFEPVRIDGSSDIYAAYIMNDAVESFFVFEQPVITGTYKDIESEQIAGVEKLEDGYMLIVNQGGENVFTIKFVKLSITSTYFNYGCMGHFWVKGYEYLRQLEYQFAVIRDKYRFLGSSSCNEKELVFMRLADFPQKSTGQFPKHIMCLIPIQYILKLSVISWKPQDVSVIEIWNGCLKFIKKSRTA